MAPSFSKLIYSKATAATITSAFAVFYISRLAPLTFTRQKRKSTLAEIEVALKEDKTKRSKAAVDLVFFKRLFKILRILIPGWFSTEVSMPSGQKPSGVNAVKESLSLLAFCSIIRRNQEDFKMYLTRFMFAMPSISLVNNVLKFGLNQLKLRFRKRLTNNLYDNYLRGFTYYKMTNLDNRVANADQLLTQDVEKFCNSVADLYSNLSKPVLDIVIYIRQLTMAIGAQGPGTMIGYLAVAGMILTRLRKPTSQMTVQEQRYEGEFRYVNARLITNSEEIAFYQGNKREEKTIQKAFNKLIEHLNTFITFRFTMGFIDNIIAKYLATCVGWYVVSRPFLDPNNAQISNMDQAEALKHYYNAGRMLIRLSEAIGRVVLSGRELARLAGFTERVYELMEVLKDLNRGKYERTMVREGKDSDSEDDRAPLVPGSGKMVYQDNIIDFKQVPLVTPNGDVLVKEMTFTVNSGINVLICGPNGCGKSSLFRILGELWPLFGGEVVKPEARKLFYVPQRPYMTLGTLRDQIIYPDSKEDMLQKGITDQELEDSIAKVQLTNILEREGGWDSVQDWMDVLSGGEKQRVAMARLFYHKPQFAILDECTSAVSVDVEGYIYSHAREVGITLFTVSHRKSLWKHHHYYLMFDGRGEYEFKKISSETEEFGS